MTDTTLVEASPAPVDVLVASLYQAACQELGCNWEGVVTGDHAAADREAADHVRAHQLAVAHGL